MMLMNKVVKLEGEIVGKGRPYFSTQDGRKRAITPKKTRTFESYVKLMTKQQFKEPFKKPLRVEMLIKKKPPRSWSKKKKRAAIAGDIAPTAKPDLDNYAKSILDGMNGVAWIDDSYVVDLRQQKEYAEEDGALIVITEIEKVPAYPEKRKKK